MAFSSPIEPLSRSPSVSSLASSASAEARPQQVGASNDRRGPGSLPGTPSAYSSASHVQARAARDRSARRRDLLDPSQPLVVSPKKDPQAKWMELNMVSQLGQAAQQTAANANSTATTAGQQWLQDVTDVRS